MAIDVLGNGVDNNVCTMLQWILNIRAHKGVINNNPDPVRMGYFSDTLDINKRQSWIRRCLDPNKLGLRSNDGVDINFNAAREGHGDTVRCSNLCEVSVGAAVDIAHGDDMRAWS